MAEDPSRSDSDDSPVDEWLTGRTASADRDDETDGDADGDEWTAPLGTGDEVDRSASDESADPDGEDEDDPYAPEPNSAPVEPGAPSLENAAFVLLGALAMVAVIFRMVSLGFG